MLPYITTSTTYIYDSYKKKCSNSSEEGYGSEWLGNLFYNCYSINIRDIAFNNSL